MTNQSVEDTVQAHRGHSQKKGRSLFTIALTLMAVLLTGPAAFATPTLLTDGGGQLTGANGVTVDGNLYDVSFVDGTCFDVFNGCTEDDFYFQDFDLALLGAQALLDQVLLDTALGNFDSIPSLTLGCESSSLCGIFTPYRTRSNNTKVRSRSASNEASDQIRLTLRFSTDDLGSEENNVWAVWTEHTPIVVPPPVVIPPVPNNIPGATVPEPTTMVLLSSGLVGLIGYRWRQRQGEQKHIA